MSLLFLLPSVHQTIPSFTLALTKPVYPRHLYIPITYQLSFPQYPFFILHNLYLYI
ncbi:hypothetical protein CLU79DRAFT_769996 [Phycomyces nitens]|nr:hypothetical protein CLU79DRAFT_769996 [Phycomyces nitens]